MNNTITQLANKCRNWLTEEALPFWADSGFNSETGIFAEEFEYKNGNETVSRNRFRVQARQVFVFAHAKELGLFDASNIVDIAIEKGFDKFRNDQGEFVFCINSDEKAKDDVNAYEHAFALLAYAWHYKMSGNESSLSRMDEVYQWIKSTLKDESNPGYYYSRDEREFKSQNPHMHLFEALMSCFEVTQDLKWLERSEEIYNLFNDFFLEKDKMREFFDIKMGTSHPACKHIDPGHHYEWIWLLNHYSHLTGKYLGSQMKALESFVKPHGQNPNGLVRDEMNEGWTEYRSTSRLWCQTEYLKAQIALFELTQDETYIFEIEGAVKRIFDNYFESAFHGGWVDQVDKNGSPIAETSPASTFYHIYVAFTELLRLDNNMKKESIPSFDFVTGKISGENIIAKDTLLSSLKGIFSDTEAFSKMDPNKVIYSVEMVAAEEKNGELHFGVSHIEPGTVGDEFHITRGHIHKAEEQAEYYFGISGKGLLLLQDESGNVTYQDVYPGSVNYITGHVAHRLVNIGEDKLSVMAVWPAIAGHNYAFNNGEGFNARVFKTKLGYEIK
ncbi:AGE family epimerase/isomerase [Vibrio parahaemolyticus]|uniref:AGE family epimerase/isomerase n=1 Tax=Vibrio parahaemolyticus TaxID=670 RepID=UPI0015DE913B|nr:AGE family epimerase/isomerase [Vibrio parahaemolyticus]HCM1552926.1 AGE family epimerase/isomerase [Vibrio parahaemolyticus]